MKNIGKEPKKISNQQAAKPVPNIDQEQIEQYRFDVNKSIEKT